jgi:hypothetical protein
MNATITLRLFLPGEQQPVEKDPTGNADIEGIEHIVASGIIPVLAISAPAALNLNDGITAPQHICAETSSFIAHDEEGWLIQPVRRNITVKDS